MDHTPDTPRRTLRPGRRDGPSSRKAESAIVKTVEGVDVPISGPGKLETEASIFLERNQLVLHGDDFVEHFDAHRTGPRAMSARRPLR